MSYELYDRYIENGEIENAILVGSNLMRRYPKDIDHFNAFIGFLCELAEGSDDPDEMEAYYELARDTCSIFTSEMEINTDKDVEHIGACHKRLALIHESIMNARKTEKEKQDELLKEQNRELLNQAESLLEEIKKINDKESLVRMNARLQSIADQIDRDALDDASKVKYDQVTAQLNEEIADCVERIDLAEKREYNKMALNDYFEVLIKFNSNKKVWSGNIKSIEKSLKPLFAYDGNKLFQETQLYKSYVFNFIFSNISAEYQKYMLTWLAVSDGR